jgi:hypothetical protein
MPGHTLSQFISNVYLPQLHAMVYGPSLYLAYGQIACGIELLGACRDAHNFDQQGHSKCRFERGITDYMAQVDARYATYNNSASPYYLYKHLRCGMAHLLRPQGKVAFIGRGNANEGGIQHFDIPQPLDKLVLIGETFYDHFEQACGLLLADLPGLPHPKLQGEFLPVNEI